MPSVSIQATQSNNVIGNAGNLLDKMEESDVDDLEDEYEDTDFVINDNTNRDNNIEDKVALNDVDANRKKLKQKPKNTIKFKEAETWKTAQVLSKQPKRSGINKII